MKRRKLRLVRSLEERSGIRVRPAVETGDAEPASAAAGKLADTAASL